MPRKYPRGYYHYLLCYEDGTPFYAGYGRENRYYHSHRRLMLTGNVDLSKLRSQLPIVIVVEAVSKDHARSMEAAAIIKYGRLDNGTGVLLNSTDGLGSSGRSFSEQARARIGNAARNRVVSEGTRAKQSKSMLGNTRAKGLVHTEATRELISLRSKGRKLTLSDEERARRSERVRLRNLTEQNPMRRKNPCTR